MLSSDAFRKSFFWALAGLVAVSLVEFSASPQTAQSAIPTEEIITIPTGTILRVRLNGETPLAVSNEMEPVIGELAGPVVVHGRTVLPEGSHLLGVVTELEKSGKARAPAQVSLRFTAVSLPHPAARYPIETRSAVRDASLLLKRGAVVAVRLSRPLIVRAV